jgi:hypothetical protein
MEERTITIKESELRSHIETLLELNYGTNLSNAYARGLTTGLIIGGLVVSVIALAGVALT